MRRILTWLPWCVGGAVGLPALVLGSLLLAANTPAGRELLESSVNRFSAGTLSVQGLSGRFPDDFGVARIEVKDRAGTWLTIEHVALAWSPTDLLLGMARAERLAARLVSIERLPASESEASDGETALPVALDIRSLEVGRLELAPAVAGPFSRAMTIEGALHLVSLEQGRFEVSVRELDGEGTYLLRGRLDPSSLQATFSLREPAHGAITSAAGFTGLGPLALEAACHGPRSDIRTEWALSAGELRAEARGSVDLVKEAADLTLAASAPAMQPREDLSWHGIALNARLQGPFARMSADGTLAIDALRAGESGARRVALNWHGESGNIRADGKLEGLRVPGPRPALLAAAPVALEASATLDAVDRPVAFAVRHPLIAAEGTFRTAQTIGGEVYLRLADLAPLAEMGGMVLSGKAEFKLSTELRDDGTRLGADGRLSVTGGEGPLPALIGNEASLAASLVLQGGEVGLSRLNFAGKALQMTAAGSIGGQQLDLQWDSTLPDVHRLMPAVSGRLSARGRIKGTSNSFGLSAEVSGDIAVQGLPRGPLTVSLESKGLPDAPAASLTARGVLAGAPLQLGVRVEGKSEGAIRVDIDRADWKSAHAQGNVVLPKGAKLPLGSLDLRMARLSDLGALLGQPLSGALSASLTTIERGGHPQALLQMDAHDFTLGDDVAGERMHLELNIADPAGQPLLDGRAALAGISAGGLTGDLRLEAAGPQDGLNLRLNGDVRDLAGAGLQLQAAAQLDGRRSRLGVSNLQASWKGESLRLLAPLHVGFADGVVLDRLHLGLRDAELEAEGRIAPAMNLTMSLRRLPANLAALFRPDLMLDGHVQAHARLSGPPSRVTGDIEVAAEGLHLRSGSGSGLPPAQLKASAQLRGDAARIDGQARAGQNLSLSVSGQVPMTPAGLYDVRATGAVDLKLLDPLLTAEGRRMRGRLALDGGIAGTRSEPRMTGRIQLDKGEWQDYAQGVHLADLTALLQAEGDTIRLVRLQGRAGPGTVLAQGSVAAFAPGMPVDLNLTARKASLPDRERLAVNLNADVVLTGQLRGDLAAAGKIRINRAEIRIPERMPSNVVILDVREAGAPPPPPPAPGPDVALNLTLDAPREIFVRGRGLDAELGGTVHLRGKAGNPVPEGRFEMRRGQFAIAGQTLTFSRGVVGFEGGSLTNPSLDFLAQTVSPTVTANLAVTGSANKPKITLSSVPDLPQDEVLAKLLFGRGASELSILEMVQIASAVASLTGLTSSNGDPLDGIRSGLGLDRLSVGSGTSGPTLEAGRYVAPGVYLGAKQGASLYSTQGTVQVDVARGVKVEASVGTGAGTGTSTGMNAGTSSVGVIYQFEY